ncbi:YjcZ family sporulation protein [Priestia megaterium]|nr:YjcZ family sporulation protein [Priestia megaterium]MCR8867282.1 YjcZ family sporulation protein [Priestia megaterium]
MSESTGGFNFGSSFALIVVLFVLLIIVGCSCTGLGGY